jgi:hypothetical protein
MVADPVLTAEFVQAIPLLISSAVELTPDQVIVISIISASGVGGMRRKVRRATVGGIVTTLSIPQDQVDALQLALRDPTSNLYSSNNGQLAYLLDATFPLTNNTDSKYKGKLSLHALYYTFRDLMLMFLNVFFQLPPLAHLSLIQMVCLLVLNRETSLLLAQGRLVV